jgi:hypothetical protein
MTKSTRYGSEHNTETDEVIDRDEMTAELHNMKRQAAMNC